MPELTSKERLYLSHGLIPPWLRVWSEGRDITNEPPETWPWPWSKYYAEGWRPYRPEEAESGRFGAPNGT